MDIVAANIEKSKLLSSTCNRQLPIVYYEKRLSEVVVTVPLLGSFILFCPVTI